MDRDASPHRGTTEGRSLRVLIVTGIYPPDIGGPATHAADLRQELVRRGHRVRVLTVGDGAGVQREPGVVRLPRRWPWPIRQVAVVREVVRQASRLDAVYATGLHAAAVAAARLCGVPVVVKIVGDPAWERGQRRGLTKSRFEVFRSEQGGPTELRAMRALRNWSVRNATQVVVPSEFLRAVVQCWTDGPAPLVIPNGVSVQPFPPGERHTEDVLRAVFVGRLVRVKQVANIVRAVATTSRIQLEIVGDGPERTRLEKLTLGLGVSDRVRFRGALPHPEVLRMLAQADALVLASDVEGLPHVVIEALVVGTPVVAPPVGGVPEVVRHRISGLIVETPSEHDLAAALAELRDDPSLWRKLSRGASMAGVGWRFEACADRIEGLLGELALKRPRVVFLGKTRIPDGRADDLDRKMAVLADRLEPVLVAVGAKPGISRRSGATWLVLPDLRPRLLGGLVFYTLGPVIALREAARSRPSGISCQSPFDAVGVLALRGALPVAWRRPVLVEVHGDWRTAARLYGSNARKLVAPLADRGAAWALRHADRVRVVNRRLEEAVREVGFRGDIDDFVAYSSYGLFAETRLSEVTQPVALFAGVLEPYKAVEVLIEAWAAVHRRLPVAHLHIAGEGPLRDSLAARARELGIEGSITSHGRVARTSLLDLMDSSSVLVLPSRSEGMPRVVLEAMARGRAVVATDVGGVGELVLDGRNGRIVRPGDSQMLAEALLEILSDLELASKLGAEGRRMFLLKDPASEFVRGMAGIADWVRAQ